MATKMTEKLEARVERVLDEAIELADLGGSRTPAHKIAQRIFETETALMEEVARTYVLERLTWMINRRRRAMREMRHPDQLVLPDPIFRDLPKTIFLRNGKRPRLNYCTLKQTEDHLRLLRERFQNSARVKQFEALVALHRKWAVVQRDIPLIDAMRREAEERLLGQT